MLNFAAGLAVGLALQVVISLLASLFWKPEPELTPEQEAEQLTALYRARGKGEY